MEETIHLRLPRSVLEKPHNPKQGKKKKIGLIHHGKTKEHDFTHYSVYTEKNQTYGNWIRMINARTVYKEFIRKKKYLKRHITTIGTKQGNLNQIDTKNAKESWVLLKGPSPKDIITNKLDSSDFYEYFKAVNNPDSIFLQPDEDTLHFNERYLKTSSRLYLLNSIAQ